jgi:hypothetical protein
MVVPLPGFDATQSGPTRPSTRGRGMPRRLFLVGGALVGGVLAAAVLAGAMSDAVTSRAIAQEAAAANALVAARLAAVAKEIDYAATPAFQGFAARKYGYGRASERLFGLAAGAPAPPSIEPLGGSKLAAPPPDALDAVLDLLFER